jgi:hypothetical protein
MKLSQLAAKPQLTKIVLDDKDVIKEFGEPLEFYTWDRQPLTTFTKLAAVAQSDNSAMIDIVRTLILDENGKEILSADTMLPSGILLKVIAKIVEQLGK